MSTDVLDPRLVFSQPDRIAAFQENALRHHLRHAADHSPFYRDRLRGIDPERFTLDQLATLPLTAKEEFARMNDAFLAVPPAHIADISFSSGTTGEPVQISYTESDLRRLAYNEAQAFRGCGILATDIVLLTCTMDRCFVAGLAYFLGARALGAAVIRNGLNTLEGHAHILRRTRPTVIVGVPSFLRKLASHLAHQGVPPDQCSVRALIGIGEPLRDADFQPTPTAVELERAWNARVYSTYATSETISTFCECPEQRGGHVPADLALVEISDEQGRPVPAGTCGEVVMTPLHIEGMPLIRFQTGDIAFIDERPCPCGRTTPRLGPIIGRKHHMLKCHGTTLYPPAIQAAVEGLPGISEFYVLAERGADGSDAITIHASFQGPAPQRDALREHLQARLRVTPLLVIEDDVAVRGVVYTQASRKPIRFIDRRT